jgi:lipopolysaccharide/colanic/teichoic acid biosynthesis glycosyltransferase
LRTVLPDLRRETAPVPEPGERAAGIVEEPGYAPPEVPSPPPDWDALMPVSWYARRGRRLFDHGLLIVAWPLALLPLLLVGLLNLIAFGDPRRILFTQSRIGWRGRQFTIYKFRTMRELPTSEIDSWSSEADRLRVTRLGRLLRNTHLDEVPQLFNILRGDMSFIGPRPEMTEIEAWANDRVPGFTARLVIRPGITGLAQITQGYTGPSQEAYAEKLSINERYLREVSFVGDLRIVFGTVIWMARGRGWWRKGRAPRPE